MSTSSAATLQAASKAGALLAELEAAAKQGSKFSTPSTVSNISPDLNIDVDLNILSSDEDRNAKDLSSIASSLNSQTQAELRVAA